MIDPNVPELNRRLGAELDFCKREEVQIIERIANLSSIEEAISKYLKFEKDAPFAHTRDRETDFEGIIRLRTYLLNAIPKISHMCGTEAEILPLLEFYHARNRRIQKDLRTPFRRARKDLKLGRKIWRSSRDLIEGAISPLDWAIVKRTTAKYLMQLFFLSIYHFLVWEIVLRLPKEKMQALYEKMEELKKGFSDSMSAFDDLEKRAADMPKEEGYRGVEQIDLTVIGLLTELRYFFENLIPLIEIIHAGEKKTLKGIRAQQKDLQNALNIFQMGPPTKGGGEKSQTPTPAASSLKENIWRKQRYERLKEDLDRFNKIQNRVKLSVTEKGGITFVKGSESEITALPRNLHQLYADIKRYAEALRSMS